MLSVVAAATRGSPRGRSWGLAETVGTGPPVWTGGVVRGGAREEGTRRCKLSTALSRPVGPGLWGVGRSSNVTLHFSKKDLGLNGPGLERGERKVGTGLALLSACAVGPGDVTLLPVTRWLRLNSWSPLFSQVVTVAKRSIHTISWFLLRLENTENVVE